MEKLIVIVNENNEKGSNQVIESNEKEATNKNSCGSKFEDRTYSATVDYNNPETVNSAIYMCCRLRNLFRIKKYKVSINKQFL